MVLHTLVDRRPNPAKDGTAAHTFDVFPLHHGRQISALPGKGESTCSWGSCQTVNSSTHLPHFAWYQHPRLHRGVLPQWPNMQDDGNHTLGACRRAASKSSSPPAPKQVRKQVFPLFHSAAGKLSSTLYIHRPAGALHGGNRPNHLPRATREQPLRCQHAQNL